MQIGIDATRTLHATRTGTERYSLEIIRHLLSRRTHDLPHWRLYVDQPTAPDFFLADKPADPTLLELCTLPSRAVWTHRALGPEVVRRPPDALFVPAHVLPFILPANRLPPSVVTVHDLGYRHFPALHTRRQRWYLEAGTRWSAAAAQAVICVSRATADELHAAYGTAWEKLHVIHEAVGPRPERLTAAEIATVRQQWALTRPFALYVGTIQPRKNLLRLLEAYAAAHGRRPDWTGILVLAGNPGWLSEPLLKRRAELGLTDRIHLPGYVSEQARIALLQTAEFFCFPSLHEGFGLPVLEAQQMGVPVMTSNNSSLPEIAGKGALLIDPTDVEALADAMLRLSRDETLRQALIEAGYENVKRFSWEKAADETLAVLESVATPSHA